MGGVKIIDWTGAMANVTIADREADNGVTDVIDTVLFPGSRPAYH